MGPAPSSCGGDTKDSAETDAIDKLLAFDKKKSRGILKVLLLGSGETGKSTFLKQLKIINKIPVAQIFQLQHQAQILKQHIINCCRQIIPHLKKPSSKEVKEAIKFLEETPSDDVNNPLFAKYLPIVVQLPEVPDILKDRIELELQLPIEPNYFFPRVKDIFHPSYVPTQPDLLRTRQLTTGIHEFDSTSPDGSTIRFIDVGGQTSERRKWINHFESVNCILFFSALNSYCLPADPPYTTRFEEELAIFTSLQTLLPQTILSIFIQNKSDILQEQIKTHPIHKYIKGAPENMNFDEGVAFLAGRFKSRFRGNIELKFFVTNSLDTELTTKIWDQIRNDLITKVIGKHGFVAV